MQNLSATYSPEDNKLRLYSTSRLDDGLYKRVHEAGFRFAPKQDLFVAPAWSPSREDLLLELCGEVGDEDTTLVDRAEDRADRFEDYSEKRASEAHTAREAVAAIADHIPLGQRCRASTQHDEEGKGCSLGKACPESDRSPHGSGPVGTRDEPECCACHHRA